MGPFSLTPRSIDGGVCLISCILSLPLLACLVALPGVIYRSSLEGINPPSPFREDSLENFLFSSSSSPTLFYHTLIQNIEFSRSFGYTLLQHHYTATCNKLELKLPTTNNINN